MVELRMRKREIWRDGGNHDKKLGVRQYGVRVSLPCPRRQVWFLISRVITPIQARSNPIRQVVPLISHIRLYPPHHSQLHPPSHSFSSTTQPSSQNTKLTNFSQSLHGMIMSQHQVQHTLTIVCTEYSILRVQHTLSTAFSKYSILQVQHTPSTASTQHCVSTLHSHDYKLTPECSLSFLCDFPHHRPPSASYPWEIKGNVTLSQLHGWELTNWWIECLHPACHPSTASKYTSNLARLWPPSALRNSLDDWVYMNIHTWMITPSKFTLSWPPCACLNSLDYGLQVSIFMASKLISPNSLDDGLHVYLHTPSILFFESISEYTQSSSSGTPPIAPIHRLQQTQIFRL